MAIGIFGMVLILSIMAGFNKSIHQRLLSYEPHVVVYSSNLFKEELETMLNTKKVDYEQVLRFESQDIVIRTASGLFQGAMARGLSKESIQKIIVENVVRQDGGDALASNEVIFNFDLAKSLNVLESDYVDVLSPKALLQPVGSNLEIKSLSLAGVFFSQLTSSQNSNIMIYPIGSELSHKDKNIKRGYEILLKDPIESSKVKNILVQYGFKDKDVETWQERNSSLLFALKLERLALGFFLVLSVIITSFSMMGILLLLLHQKRKEIGILMAMGVSKSKVRVLFSSLGLFLSFLGISMGLIPGLLVAYLIQIYPLRIMPDIYQDPYLPAQVDILLIFMVLITCLIVSGLSLIVPLFNISKISPGSALKSM